MADVSLEFENDTEDPEEIEIIDDTEKIQKLLDEHHKQEYMDNRKSVEAKGGHGGYSLEQDTSISMVVVDPDERYLLSCLPVLKRLSPQKNALIKLKIQQLLYEVEFEMNDESHSSKKRKVN
jgi:BESS motif